MNFENPFGNALDKQVQKNKKITTESVNMRSVDYAYKSEEDTKGIITLSSEEVLDRHIEKNDPQIDLERRVQANTISLKMAELYDEEVTQAALTRSMQKMMGEGDEAERAQEEYNALQRVIQAHNEKDSLLQEKEQLNQELMNSLITATREDTVMQNQNAYLN